MAKAVCFLIEKGLCKGFHYRTGSVVKIFPLRNGPLYRDFFMERLFVKGFPLGKTKM